MSSALMNKAVGRQKYVRDKILKKIPSLLITTGREEI
jgi:hypothetical protein